MRASDYDAILFDNDGVLVELTDPDRLVEAVQRSFREFGVEVEADFVHRLVVGERSRFDLVEDHLDVDPAEWWPRREALVAEIQREELRTGRKALYGDVHELGALDRPLGLVSNNQHETVEFVLEHHDLGQYFDTYAGRPPTIPGARRAKPDPHYLERALADLGATTGLYVGDSETDVLAASRAGLDSAFLRRDHRAGVSLDVDPTAEFPDLTALVTALADTNR